MSFVVLNMLYTVVFIENIQKSAHKKAKTTHFYALAAA